MPLLNTADKVYLGTQPASAVYLGASKVWPSGFDPRSLAGLVIWLDASQLGLADGASVTPWPNLGSGIDAAIVGTPAPVVKTGILNGLPVVRFTAYEGRVRSSGTGAGEAGLNWTVVYVARLRDAVMGRVVTAIYTPSNLLIGFWNGYENVAFVEGFLTPDLKRPQTTNWRMYTGTGEGVIGSAKAWFYEDGVFQSGNHPVSGGWQNTFAISGYDPSVVAETCNCDVAELLFYNHRLADAERVQVEGYLRAKWLSLPPPVSPSSKLLVSYTPGTDRNDFTGEVGVRLGIGASPLTVDWVGARSNGYPGTRTVKLYEWFSGTVQRTITIDYTGVAAGDYVWTQMTPITLAANGYYALLMVVTASDGQWWKNPGPATFQSSIVNVYDSYYSGGLQTGSQNSSFVGLDLGST